MRFLLSFVLILPILLHWWFIWVPGVMWVSFRHGAAWFIVVAFLLDGYFGHFHTWPVLTVSALVWYWIVTIVRPHITTGTEMI